MSSTDSRHLQDRVNKICDDFIKKGTNPTVRLVLAELTGVSSTSTVHKYFSKWKVNQIAKQESLFDKFGLSTEFTTSFMKEINRFTIEIERRYKELAQDAHEQREQAISDLEKLEGQLSKNADLFGHYIFFFVHPQNFHSVFIVFLCCVICKYNRFFIFTNLICKPTI